MYDMLKKKEIELSENITKKRITKEIKTLKKQIELEENEEIQKRIKYMKQLQFEHANKPGRWLAHRLKKQRERNIITEIKTQEKVLSTDQERIKEEFLNFYEKLYKGGNISKQSIQEFLKKSSIKQFDNQQRDILNKPISVAEITEVIKNSKKGKTPGPDGFPVEYYQKFEEQLIIPYKLTLNEIGKQKYPGSWKQANVSLIVKEGRDPTDVKSYRPISLLNTDYKLFAKILAERFKKVLAEWIQEEQAGFLPKRQLKKNIRVILNTIEYYERNNGKSLALVFMDLEKAFDNISWGIIFNMMEEAKVGTQFDTWIREIYKEQSARIIVNYSKTKEFKINKGTRQGCPLSPLLFIFVLEALNNRIREEKQIGGMKIRNHEYKMRIFADDIVYILENPTESIEKLIEILTDFEKVSGLKVNKDKTAMVTKNLDRKDEKLLSEISGFMVKKKAKYLGIWITSKNVDLYHNNYEIIWREIKKDLERWGNLRLSLLGRISVIQMNILPKMLFLFQTIPILHTLKPLNMWQKEILSFVWEKKKARIKAKIVYDDKARGGLGLPNLTLYYYAAVLVWIVEWLLLEDDKLIVLEGDNLRFGLHGYLFYSKCKVHKECKNHILRKAMLHVWEKLRPRISQQILLACSPHEAFFSKERIPRTKWIKYSDLVKEVRGEKELKAQEELKAVGINCHWYLYRQLRERWKMDERLIGINSKKSKWEEIVEKGERKMITRNYKMLLEWDTEEEIIRESMIKWSQNVGHSIDYIKWEKVWKGTKFTINQELKENTYKMLYRWHLSPQKIAYMSKNKKSNPLCWKCNIEVGTFFHMWWTCKTAKQYWIKIYKVINIELKISITFNPETFLLGMISDELNKTCGKLLFYLFTCARITYARYWKQKEIPSVEQWLIKVFEVAEMDKRACWTKDKTEEEVEKEWHVFYEFLRSKWKNVMFM